MNILEKIKHLKELSEASVNGPRGPSGMPWRSYDPDLIIELCLCVEEMSQALKFYGRNDIHSKDFDFKDNGTKARVTLEKWVGK